MRNGMGSHSFRITRQWGVSLVELLIAITLSSVLVFGLIQVFSSNQVVFNVQDSVARMQESGRIAMEFIGRDARQAGFVGCASQANFVSNVDPNSNNFNGNDGLQEAITMFSSGQALEVFNDVSAAAFPTALTNLGLNAGTNNGELVEGSDVVVFQGARPCQGGRVTAFNANSAQFTIESNDICNIQQNDIVVVANCQNSVAFGVSNNVNNSNITHGANNNITPQLPSGESFGNNDSFVYQFSTQVYYVGAGANGEPSLFLRSLQGQNFQVLELAEGTADMQILLGEDDNSDGSPDRFVDADVLADFDDVLSARIALLMQSEDGTTTAPQAYRFAGTTFDGSGGNPLPTDNRLRVSYESNFTLRNRVN